VAGYKKKIDETPWIVASVRHTIDQAEGVEGQEGADI